MARIITFLESNYTDRGYFYQCLNGRNNDFSGDYVSLKDYEAIKAENARLREALKPFARIAELSEFPKGINVTLWERTHNIQDDNIAITLDDCKAARDALGQ